MEYHINGMSQLQLTVIVHVVYVHPHRSTHISLEIVHAIDRVSLNAYDDHCLHLTQHLSSESSCHCISGIGS